MAHRCRGRPLCGLLIAVTITTGGRIAVRAADVVKANNTTNLVDGGSWVDGIAPTNTDVALWNSTVTAANTSDLGGNLSIAGIKITNPGNAIGITSGTVNSGAVTANSTADTFTYTGTDVVNGNIVSFGGTTMPGGITNGRLYFIVNVDTTAKTYQVSDTPTGSAINFTSNGTSVTNTAVSALTIGSSGIDLGSATRSLTTLSAPVSLSAPQTWTTGSGRVIDINNNTNNFGVSVLNNGNTLTIETVGNSSVDLGNISGGGGITKNGAGTLNLYSGASNYTGDVVINAGTVNAGSDAGSLGAGSLTMNGGTLTAKANGARSFGRNTTIGGNASFYNNNSGNNGAMAYTFGTLSIGSHTFTVTANGSGTGTLTFGATTLAGSPTFDVGNRDINFLVLGAVGESGGSRGFTKSGVGTLRLSGASTYTGTTTISGGLLELTGAGSLPAAGAVVNDATLNVSGITAAGLTIGSLAGSGTVALGGKAMTVGDGTTTTFSGGITGAGGALVKQGAGRLTLSGSSSYDGSTTIQTGTLRAANESAFGAGSLALAGGRLELAADAPGTFGSGSGYAATVTGNATIASDRLTSGSGVALSLGSLSIGAHTLTVAAGDAVTSGVASLVIDGLTTLSGNATFSTGSGAELRLGSISGAFAITKTGSGTLTLAGSGNSHTDTTVNAGQLNVNHFAALGTPSGTLTMAAGTRLDNTSGAAVTVTNPKSIALGSSLTFVGSDDLDLGTGTVTLSGNTEFDIVAKELTLSGDVLGAGFGITKTGTGTLRLDGLSGSNSFTGNSVVNAGTLLLEGSSILGGGSSTVVTLGANGFLELGPSASLGNVTIAGFTGNLISGTVVNANQDFTQSVTLTTVNEKYNGVQTIQSGVTVTTGHNYLGTIPATTTPGRIVFEDGAAIRVTTGFELSERQGITLESGTAIFESDADQAFLVPSSVAGSGGIRKIGAGNVRLTGSNTYAGGTVIEQGIVGISYGASLGDVNGRLTLDGGTVVAAQLLSGGTITTVTIESGRQVVLANGKTSGLDAQTGLTLRYDGVIAEENGAGAPAGLRIGSGVPRQGTVILGGVNTYRGDTTIGFGTLKLAAGGSFATSSRIIVGGSGSSGVALDLTEKSNFSIGSGQTLMGGGTVKLGASTVLTVAGTFSPGNSPGLFTYSSGTTLLAGTTLMEIWGTSRATSPSHGDGFYDAVNVTDGGVLDFNGSILALSFDSLFNDGDTFELFKKFDTAGLAGNFGSVVVTGSFYTGLEWTDTGTGWLSSAAAGGETLSFNAATGTLSIVAAVPEPGALSLAGIGVAVAGWTLWKRRRHTGDLTT